MDSEVGRTETPAIDISIEPGWNGVERRSEARVPEDSPARIKILDPMVSLGPSFQGRVVDTSGKGLKFRASRSILPGSVVQLRYRDGIVLGKVRYCTPIDDEFYVGIRLKENW